MARHHLPVIGKPARNVPRDYVYDRILRELEASGFLARALGEPAR